MVRENPAGAERLDQRDAISDFVLRRDIHIGGDKRAQVVAERDIRRRTVVQRANADMQQMLGNHARFTREPADDVGGRSTTEAVDNPEQIGRAEVVHALKRIEHRRHE